MSQPLTDEQVNEHLTTLRVACDPRSPFHGMVNFKSEGGLLSLPIPQQQQIFDAMPKDLRAMVEGS